MTEKVPDIKSFVLILNCGPFVKMSVKSINRLNGDGKEENKTKKKTPHRFIVNIIINLLLPTNDYYIAAISSHFIHEYNVVDFILRSDFSFFRSFVRSGALKIYVLCLRLIGHNGQHSALMVCTRTLIIIIV